MSIRTTETTVTFRLPYTSAVDGVRPAGTCRLVTDEEQMPGLSFVAFQRMTTTLHLPSSPSPGCKREVVNVDPAELVDALNADAA